MQDNAADEYRRKAEECRLLAGKAVGDPDKVAWLKLAEDWQRLAESTSVALGKEKPNSDRPST